MFNFFEFQCVSFVCSFARSFDLFLKIVCVDVIDLVVVVVGARALHPAGEVPGRLPTKNHQTPRNRGQDARRESPPKQTATARRASKGSPPRRNHEENQDQTPQPHHQSS